jgi:hypothetical protein
LATGVQQDLRTQMQDAGTVALDALLHGQVLKVPALKKPLI